MTKEKSWSLIWYVKSFIERLPKFIAWLLPRAAHHRNGSFCEAILSMQGFRIRAIHARTMTWRPPRIKTVTSRPCTETETNKQATRKFYNYTIVTLQLQKITHLELETKKQITVKCHIYVTKARHVFILAIVSPTRHFRSHRKEVINAK